MLKAVLFDLDQTLMDWSGRTEDWQDHQRQHIGYLYEYVNEHVFPLAMNIDELYDIMVANVVAAWTDAKITLIAPHIGEVMVKTLKACGVPPEQIKMDDCLKAYKHQLVGGVTAYSEVPDVLKTFQQHNIQMGIATNAFQPMWMRDAELVALDLIEYFEDGLRLSAADVGHLKPHAAIFETLLSRLEIEPSEAVFVGDNLHADIGGAQAVGMRAVWREHDAPLAYEQASDATIRDIQPDATIHSLTELLPILDQWFPEWRRN